MVRPSRETIGERSRTHGMSKTREFRIWVGMHTRCFNHKAVSFERYGKRGITICKRWKDNFFNFFADMGKCPAGMSIDRIDNDGNYEPSNCKWSTRKEQASNRRVRKDTRYITAHGLRLSVPEWSAKLSLRRKTILERLYRGWAGERAITKIRKYK